MPLIACFFVIWQLSMECRFLKLKMSESQDSFENNFMLKSVLYTSVHLGFAVCRKLLRYCQQKVKKPQKLMTI